MISILDAPIIYMGHPSGIYSTVHAPRYVIRHSQLIDCVSFLRGTVQVGSSVAGVAVKATAWPIRDIWTTPQAVRAQPRVYGKPPSV